MEELETLKQLVAETIGLSPAALILTFRPALIFQSNRLYEIITAFFQSRLDRGLGLAGAGFF